jgi:hypothetical protein
MSKRKVFVTLKLQTMDVSLLKAVFGYERNKRHLLCRCIYLLLL